MTASDFSRGVLPPDGARPVFRFVLKPDSMMTIRQMADQGMPCAKLLPWVPRAWARTVFDTLFDISAPEWDAPCFARLILTTDCAIQIEPEAEEPEGYFLVTVYDICTASE